MVRLISEPSAERVAAATRTGAALRRAAGMVLLAAALASGARASSAQASEPREAGPPPVAFFPMDNLSGAAAPLNDVGSELRQALASAGVPLLEERNVAEFLRRHRIRYTGGVASEAAVALADETEARFVLIASLDAYRTTLPPHLALTARLVSVPSGEVVWIDAFDRVGDESPGFLDTGVVRDIAKLRARGVRHLVSSLSGFLKAETDWLVRTLASKPEVTGWKRRFAPRRFYRNSQAPVAAGGRVRVAVLPFINESDRKAAGDVLALQFVRQLARLDGVDVVEPGIVREALLRGRLVQEGGVSLPQADLLKVMVDADLVVSGIVTDYDEVGAGGRGPYVAFSVRGFDTRAAEVVWSSVSHNRGNDGVFFFGGGRVSSAHRLSGEMARAVVGKMRLGDLASPETGR